jgi:hypothetical protein
MGLAEEYQKLMQQEAIKQGLGPTGKFPEGKIVEHDEGEIQIAITHHVGKVIINFGTPVAFIGFTPEQAESIAYTLLKHSTEARKPSEFG